MGEAKIGHAQVLTYQSKAPPKLHDKHAEAIAILCSTSEAGTKRDLASPTRMICACQLRSRDDDPGAKCHSVYSSWAFAWSESQDEDQVKWLVVGGFAGQAGTTPGSCAHRHELKEPGLILVEATLPTHRK